VRQREGLIARVKQIRTAGAASERHAADAAEPPSAASLDELALRMSHLEQQVRGLQDSVHRENVRLGAQVAELAARMEPAALAVALDKDARERGL